jgi:hypothetical protein
MTTENDRNKKLRAYLLKLLNRLEFQDIKEAKKTEPNNNRIILDITFER